MSILLYRDAGHPWSSAAGWDQLALQFSSLALLDEKIDDAARKHWHIWIRDQMTSSALLFKPSGMQAQWEDEPRHGTPRSMCLGLSVGEQVYTDFSGQPTRHRVTDRKLGTMTQTGCMLRVTPAVPGASFVADDPNAAIRQRGLPWIDSAWFRPAHINQEHRHV